MKKLTLSIAFISIFIALNAQYDCSVGRFYNTNFFSSVQTTNTILFGQNIGVGVATQEKLYMDIFEPQGDTLSKRPVVVLAFGGSFIQGDRTQVQNLCKELAKMGYVTAAIDYRIGLFTPNKVNTTMAVIRAMHDMKAAIRYLWKDAATTNTFRVDTTMIIVGGVSSGAVTSLHCAFLSENDGMPSYLSNDTAGLGGIEGNSGNSGYPSTVMGVINLSGALGDTSWIDVGDPPVVSIHDDGDGIVPYDTREVLFGGTLPTGLISSGSRDINQRLLHQGVPTKLRTINSTGHVSYMNSSSGGFNDLSDFNFVKDFIGDLVCDKLYASAQNNTLKKDGIVIYPNPSNTSFTVKIATHEMGLNKVDVYDITGQIVRSVSSNSALTTIERGDLSSGVYFLKISGQRINKTQKVILY